MPSATMRKPSGQSVKREQPTSFVAEHSPVLKVPAPHVDEQFRQTRFAPTVCMFDVKPALHWHALAEASQLALPPAEAGQLVQPA